MPLPHQGFQPQAGGREGGERADRGMSGGGSDWGRLIKDVCYEAGGKGGVGDPLMAHPEKARVRSTDK